MVSSAKPVLPVRYSVETAIDVILLATRGLTYDAIASELSIKDGGVIDLWASRKPFLRYGLDQARKEAKRGKGKPSPSQIRDGMIEYIYQHLPPKLKTLWSKIEFWAECESGVEKIELLLAGEDERVRQHLWMHAMICANFNMSVACKLVGVSRSRIELWKENDPDFPDLMKELEFHKKNFFEAALTDLVTVRDTQAVIFANRTINRDRGYAEKVEMKHTGQIDLNHHIIPLEVLDLPVEVLLQIEEAQTKYLEKQKQLTLTEGKGQTMSA